MRLFSRPISAQVIVEPAVAFRTETVRATARVAKPIDRVESARIELGYLNTYYYRWAGRADAAAVDDGSLLTDVGTDYGSNRQTTDWIPIVTTELAVPGGTFDGGSATFRIPSWAPGSGAEIVRWACRLVVRRKGDETHEDGEFTILVESAADQDEPTSTERVAGDASMMAIRLDNQVVRTGATIRGHLDVVAERDLPPADIAVLLERERISHPLHRTPCPAYSRTFEVVQLDKRLRIPAGRPVALPFEIVVPEDAPPSATTVNATLHWFVQARAFYAGFSGPGFERVRRLIHVVSAESAD